MFKKLILVLAIFVGNGLCASESKEESPCFTQEILEKRLNCLRITDLIEKTNIVNKLLDVQHPQQVATIIESSYAEYYACIQKEMPTPIFLRTQVRMEVSKTLIYESLLHEYPFELAELQQRGIYKPHSVQLHHCA